MDATKMTRVSTYGMIEKNQISEGGKLASILDVCTGHTYSKQCLVRWLLLLACTGLRFRC